jgi:PIN domain nuclease of toxin-antitoxin system
VNLLLDTHTFLWFIGGSDRLSAHARDLIEDGENDRYISVASLWEMAIKVSIGKLNVPLPFTRLVREHVVGNAIEVLPIAPEHLDEQRKLPFHHRDPFDRLIIAQAITEDMTIVGRDAEFEAYPVRLDWGLS